MSSSSESESLFSLGQSAGSQGHQIRPRNDGATPYLDLVRYRKDRRDLEQAEKAKPKPKGEKKAWEERKALERERDHLRAELRAAKKRIDYLERDRKQRKVEVAHFKKRLREVLAKHGESMYP